MSRSEFMWGLANALAGLPQSEITRITEYYDEIFTEAIDEGKTEEEICESLGSPDDIAERVRAEMAFVRAEQKPDAKSMNAVLLLIIGLFALPIGIPVAVALVSVMFGLFAAVVAIVAAFGAVVIAVGAAGLACMVTGIAAFGAGEPWFGIAFIGASLLLFGLSVLGGVGAFNLMRVILRGMVKLCRLIYNGISERLKGRKQA
ncbi:MAG: DUF1700 domain-containing protein [Oscillospiraceae bacterium]|nr:DUF1700 domain-containing protein [Oscillospiraceae bacterium]